MLAGCVVAVSAAPRPDGPPVYGPKPVAPYKEPEVFPPQPYEYKYGVADDYSKSSFDKVETQDEYGKVQGSYKVTYLWSLSISIQDMYLTRCFNQLSPTESLFLLYESIDEKVMNSN